MPKVSDIFGPIYQNVTLDASGNGTVTFQAVGSSIRIANIFFRVATSTNQAVCTIYKGALAVGNIVFNSNSGSTGGNAKGNLDLVDGDTVFVRWTGGDVGAIATATFTGVRIPFQDIKASSLTFDDQIAAGDGSLIYPALKSPNFVAGVSGWRISRDGSAEFADATIRGSISADNGNITLDDNGIRVVGTNQTVEILDTGFAVTRNSDTSAYVHIQGSANTGGTIFIHPRASAVGGITYESAIIYAAATDTITASRPFMQMISPAIADAPDLHTAQIILRGEQSDTGFNDAYVEFEAPRGFFWTDYDVDSGRGWVGGDGSATNSTAIGNTETVIATVSSRTYRARRSYNIVVSGKESVTVANNTPIMRVRKTGLGGLQLVANNTPHVNLGQTGAGFTGQFWVGTADVTAAIALTLQGSAAYNVTAIGPYGINIYDMTDTAAGSPADYAVELT